ncbi:glycosyltransferase involved in cell wall biosynthesis [Leucobacter exalbidus]|uniref:Glycosyltransferase involved in cell wall biosynthesis n=1 Tax=Leucobacter exalbidus TaxID=662960 RepID=A0A940T3F5_9MICO|nr:mannosyltransferase [Leucobacter exalbidus]MBP1326102.1 glycosyltransferase involved in cell wall biosynthesis [Leucobacter exalbidus]
MASLTLIAEPFPDWEAQVQQAAARDLVVALGAMAPRSCSARFLIAKGSPEIPFASAKIQTEQLPLRASLLPLLWQSGTTSRPLDGEFVHSLTPMLPIRARDEDDGSQTSVTIPHSIAWEAPELMGASQARLYRGYVRRAIKHADVLITTTHATARAVHSKYGDHIPVQVMQLAPPTDFLPGDDAAARRAELSLPELYSVTTAMPGELGRLEWLFDALRLNPTLPPLVVVAGLDPLPGVRDANIPTVRVPDDLQHRVTVVRARELADVGAILDGAALLLQPQAYTGTGYTLLAALATGVPVLHSGHDVAAEIVLDAGVEATDAGTFSAEFGRLFRDLEELHRLSVYALDHSRGFTWASTAWQLWEAHANL